MAEPPSDQLADLRRTNAELVAARRAAQNMLEDAILARDAVREREAALTAEKEYAESIVETLHEPLLVLHPDLTVKSVNSAFYTHFRVNLADTIGRKVYDLGNGQWDIPALRTLLEDVLPDSNVFNDYEVTHTFDAIGRRVMLVNARRLDHVQLILLGIRDITERKRAEDALRASEARLAAIFARAAVGLSEIALDGRFLRVNDELCQIVGRPRDELLAGGVADVTHPDDLADSMAAVARVRETGEPVSIDKRYLRPDGTVVFANSTLSLLPATPNQPAVFLAVTADLTSRRKAEADLRASERRYRAVVESQVEMICQFRSDGTILFVNEAYAREFDTTPEKLIGTSFWDLIPQDEHEEVRARLDRLTPDSPLVRIENMVVTPRGPRWTMWTNLALEFDESGRVAEAQATGVDITERRQAEEAVRASEARLAAVAANLPNAAVFLVDRDLRYLLADGEAFRATGFTPADFVGKTIREAVEPELAAGYESYYRAALAGEPFRRDHTAHGCHYVSHGVPLRSATGDVDAVLVVSYDITDRKRAEDEARAAEERLRLALSAARMGIWVLDVTTDTHTRDANLNLLLGLPAAETRTPFAEFLSHIHPDDREQVRAGFANTQQHHRPLSLEFRVIRPDGTVRWLRDQGDVFHTTGESQLAGACIDITDLKEAEAAVRDAHDRLEERVAERTQELAAAVDALEAEIERRRALARLLATAQEDERRRMARDLHDSLGQLQAGLGLAVAAARRSPTLTPATDERLVEVQRLVDELTRETHALAVRLRPTALDDLGLEPALRQLMSDLFARTDLAVDFQTTGLERERLPAEVETVIYRVVQEALTNVTRHARATRVGVVVVRGESEVTVTVEDNGAGFVPNRSGAGRLGLLGMKERVELADGSFQVESSPGEGTTVFVRIPLIRTPERGESRE